MCAVSEPSEISGFEARVRTWAAARPDIRAVALVGSHARGDARPDSDIDLVILTSQPQAYLQDTDWANAFGEVAHSQVEDWGKVTSLRVWYADGSEVEFGLTGPDWVALPLDEGTAQVIAGGIKVWYEKEGFLSSRMRANKG
jgi:predicted nucleotidyltransferase